MANQSAKTRNNRQAKTMTREVGRVSAKVRTGGRSAVPISPVNADSALHETDAFLTDSGAPPLTLLAVAN